jgi:hypothetical protein
MQLQQGLHLSPLESIKPWSTVLLDWLGQRQCAISTDTWRRVIHRPWVALVMSHRMRHPELSINWRKRIEYALHDGLRKEVVFLVAEQTPMGSFLAQTIRRLQGTVLEIVVPLPKETFLDWRSRVQTAHVAESRASKDEENIGEFARRYSLYFSPELPTTSTTSSTLQFGENPSDWSSNFPLHDRALIALADKLTAFDLHPKSKTYHLLRHRLDDSRFPVGSVFLHVDRALDPNDGSSVSLPPDHSASSVLNAAEIDLVERGAALKFRYSTDARLSPFDPNSGLTPAISEMDIHEVSANRTGAIEVDAMKSTVLTPIFRVPTRWKATNFVWPYLTHCTRGREGPWPDQSTVGYFDELLVGPPSQQSTPVSASAFETLLRILEQQRIVATTKLKRSSVPTVSLSAVPLLELLSRRRFQRHLGRWDWEPYGLCFRRELIQDLGGQPVIYIPSDQYEALDEPKRPFFQPKRLALDASTKEHDWEEEQEWRIIEDIRLAHCRFSSAFVFVPTMEEALHVQSISRLPVLCLASSMPFLED